MRNSCITTRWPSVSSKNTWIQETLYQLYNAISLSRIKIVDVVSQWTMHLHHLPLQKGKEVRHMWPGNIVLFKSERECWKIRWGMVDQWMGLRSSGMEWMETLCNGMASYSTRNLWKTMRYEHQIMGSEVDYNKRSGQRITMDMDEMPIERRMRR